MMKRVLVAIVTMNRRADLLQCLESIRTGEDHRRAILIIDNNSNDGTPEIIAKGYPDLILIRNRENIGCAAGRNQAIRYGIEHNYEYVQFLDDDVIVGQNTVDKLVAALEDSMDFGIATPTLCHCSQPEYIYWGGGTFSFKSGFRCCNKGRKVEEVESMNPMETDWVLGGVSLISRETLIKVGLLNDSMGLFGAEDLEYSVRARRSGIKLCWVPSALTYHKGDMGKVHDSYDNPVKIYYNWYTLYKIYFKLFGLIKSPYSFLVLTRRLKWQLDEFFDRGDEELAKSAISAFWDVVSMKPCQPLNRCPIWLLQFAKRFMGTKRGCNQLR